MNPYLETWDSFPVTPKPSQLDLPFENAFSYNVNAPDTLTCVTEFFVERQKKVKIYLPRQLLQEEERFGVENPYSENEMQGMMSLKL